MANDKPAEDSATPLQFLQQARELSAFVDVVPNVEALAAKLHAAHLAKRKLRVKLGVDPTGSMLHLGHAVVLRLLRRFQDLGHQAVLVIGGFTATIGDPTGRDKTRPPLSAAQVEENARLFVSQASKILDAGTLEVFNNVPLGKMTLEELASVFAVSSVNQLLAKDVFGKRMELGGTLAILEMLYPLLQAHDSISVAADIELGGSDQRFNVLMGRQMQNGFGQEPQVAMLTPILTGTDGERKMSKSFGNFIALDDAADDVFGKVMRIPDRLIMQYTELVTVLKPSQVEAARKRLDDGENPMVLKRECAAQVVRFIHGDDAAQAALENWDRVHRQREVPAVMPSHVVAAPARLVDVMVACGLAPSKGQARKFIEGGGVKLDGEKVTDIETQVAVPGTSIGTVLSHGRRQFVRLVSEMSN
jgi:tyrosyl-tRNA synthetase